VAGPAQTAARWLKLSRDICTAETPVKGEPPGAASAFGRPAIPAIPFYRSCEAPGLIRAHAAELLAPAIVRLLGNPDLATDRRHLRAVRQQDLRLWELVDDLFRGMRRLGHSLTSSRGRILPWNPDSN